MLAFMGMLIAPSMTVLGVLYFLMAFSMSAQAAATYAIGADKLGKRAAVGIPVIDGFGQLGGVVAPGMMGWIAYRIGLGRALWLVPLFGFMLVVVCLGWEWTDKSAGAELRKEENNEDR